MYGLELIEVEGITLAYLIRAAASPPATDFLTPPETVFQAGFVVYPAGGAVVPHLHMPVKRSIVGTCELLIVRSGRCFVDIYTDDRRLVATRQMQPGDSILCVGGGHGFRMIEATVLLEVKQGPFGGEGEKERFTPQAPGQAEA